VHNADRRADFHDSCYQISTVHVKEKLEVIENKTFEGCTLKVSTLRVKGIGVKTCRSAREAVPRF